MEEGLGRRAGQVGLHQVGEEAGDDAEQRQDAHGKAHAEGDLLGILALLGQLPEEHGLGHLHEGGQGQGGGHQGHDGHQGKADVAGLHGLLIGGLVDEPLGGEAVEGRDAADGGGADEEEHRGVGHLLGQAAQLAQVRGAGLMENSAGGKEQQALEQGVVHGVVEAGGGAQRRGQAHRRQHVADLGDGVEGQQALEVMLGQGHGDAHEHAHRAQEHQPELHGAQVHGLEQEVGQTDDAVDAALGEHAGDQHRDGRGSRAVGVRRQGMEGHDEGLGAEADEQQREGQLRGLVPRLPGG